MSSVMVNWTLEFLNGPLKGNTVDVVDEIVIGRQEDCDISVLDGHLSRRHLKLRLDNNKLMAEDLGSTNGSFVNGNKFNEIELNSNDVIKLDTIEIRINRIESAEEIGLDINEYTNAPDITGKYLDPESLELKTRQPDGEVGKSGGFSKKPTDPGLKNHSPNPEGLKPIEQKNVAFRPERLETKEQVDEKKDQQASKPETQAPVQPEEKTEPDLKVATKETTEVTKNVTENVITNTAAEEPRAVAAESKPDDRSLQSNKESESNKVSQLNEAPVISDPVKQQEKQSKTPVDNSQANRKPAEKPQAVDEPTPQNKTADANKPAELPDKAVASQAAVKKESQNNDQARAEQPAQTSTPKPSQDGKDKARKSKNIPWWEDQEMGPEGTRLVESINSTNPVNEFVVAEDVLAGLKGAALVGITAPFTHQVFELNPGQNNIGKSLDNHVVLDESTISATHAQVIESNGSWKLVNLLSANGTFVNEQKIQSSFLNNGDNIRFGGITLRFVAPAGVNRARPNNSSSNQKKPIKIFAIAFIVTALILAAVLAMILQ